MFCPIECDRGPGIDGVDGLGKKLKKALRKAKKAVVATVKAPLQIVRDPKAFLENPLKGTLNAFGGVFTNAFSSGAYGSGAQEQYENITQAGSEIVTGLADSMSGGAASFVRNGLRLPGGGAPVTETSSNMPAWLLPAGIGLLAVVLLKKK